jgi:hypothetical protein
MGSAEAAALNLELTPCSETIEGVIHRMHFTISGISDCRWGGTNVQQ